jgi:putative membrane protein (TIGR04086 family)
MGSDTEDYIGQSEIECPNCGEHVYFDVLVCPKCGLHFYPDETTIPDEVASPPRAGNFSISAVLAGWAASAVIAFLINLFASRIWSPQALNITGQIIVSASGPLGALVGGYLAARVAGKREKLHGLVVALLSLVIAILLETYWYDLFNQPLRLASMISWMILLPAGVFGAWIYTRTQAAVYLQLPSRSQPTEKSLYFDLLAHVRHDIDTAERLIDFERRRNPAASRAKLIQNAIERIDHDRR